MAPSTILAAALLLTLMPLCVGGDPTSSAPLPIRMPDCVRSCGDVEVSYPFGIGLDASCYLPGFNLTCDNTTGSRPRLLFDADGTLEVAMINTDFGVTSAQRNGDVKIDVDAYGNGNGTLSRGLRRDGPYLLSSGQPVGTELILTGCNVQATVKSGNDVTVASCTSLCEDAAEEATPTIDDENSVTERCSGSSTGCCRANIITPGYNNRAPHMAGSSEPYRRPGAIPRARVCRRVWVVRRTRSATNRSAPVQGDDDSSYLADVGGFWPSQQQDLQEQPQRTHGRCETGRLCLHLQRWLQRQSIPHRRVQTVYIEGFAAGQYIC